LDFFIFKEEEEKEEEPAGGRGQPHSAFHWPVAIGMRSLCQLDAGLFSFSLFAFIHLIFIISFFILGDSSTIS